MTVADFHAKVFRALRGLGIETRIQSKPNEVDPAIPLAEDNIHAAYDPNAAHLFWRQLVQADRLMNQFRSSYRGKDSLVHFFWALWISPTPGSPAVALTTYDAAAETGLWDRSALETDPGRWDHYR